MPTPFKEVRTILLYKNGNRKDPNNWRPITISSASPTGRGSRDTMTYCACWHHILRSRGPRSVSLTSDTLFKPDIAVHLPNNKIIISDVAVCWESQQQLAALWASKRRVNDHQKFREAAAKRWENKSITIQPLIMGARGIWPRCNDQVADELNITPKLKGAMVHPVLKWGSSIHKTFMATV